MTQKLILPGLIDPHVHLRDPGQTNKEDFYTGSCSAIAGGFTTILDMPNNKIPITTLKILNEKIKIAKRKIVCDVGFHFGSLGDTSEFKKIQKKVSGLKLYLNETTGNFLINKEKLELIFTAWTISLHSAKVYKNTKPILIHAEDDVVEYVINLIKKLGNKVHICHISTTEDLKKIIKAKEEGLKITCGVTPHHLFLTEKDVNRLGAFGKMKPQLASKKDQDFLWKNLKFIDVIESDHAPHTIEEKIGEGWRDWRASRRVTAGSLRPRTSDGTKERQDPEHKTPYGVPGLETTLPLLLTAVSEKKLTINDIVRLCHTNPAKIFNINRFNDLNHQSKIEIDLSQEYIIKNRNLFTKCKWSPFEGFKVKGKVLRVFIRGKKVFENGKILAQPGSGHLLPE